MCPYNNFFWKKVFFYWLCVLMYGGFLFFWTPQVEFSHRWKKKKKILLFYFLLQYVYAHTYIYVITRRTKVFFREGKWSLGKRKREKKEGKKEIMKSRLVIFFYSLPFSQFFATLFFLMKLWGCFLLFSNSKLNLIKFNFFIKNSSIF